MEQPLKREGIKEGIKGTFYIFTFAVQNGEQLVGGGGRDVLVYLSIMNKKNKKAVQSAQS